MSALVAGLNIVDVLVGVPLNIRPGCKHEVPSLEIRGGAPAGNAACIMASLGLKTSYITWLGSDAISLVAREELVRCGVDEAAFLHDPAARPGVAVVEIHPSSGERTIFYNLTGYRRVSESDIRAEWVDGASLVLVDGYETEASLPLLRIARDRGLHRVLDIETGDRCALDEMLRLGTDAILPLEGAQWLAGKLGHEDSLRELSSRTSAQVIVTDGAHGSWALTTEGLLHQPAFLVEAVDTTGCGDAYHGAYAFGLARNWPLPVRIEFAAFVASRVALFYGGRSPDLTLQSIADLNHPEWSPALREILSRHYTPARNIPEPTIHPKNKPKK